MDAQTPPSEEQLAELARQMDELRLKDPEAFESIMAASMASSVGGKSPEDALKQLEQALQAQTADSIAQEGIALPGARKMGLDGSVSEQEAGIDIEPTPSFVVKTRRTDNKDGPNKVFVNVCVHDAVAEPSLKKKLDEEGNEVEGLNVPVSVGPPRPGQDKKGEASVVYDCVVNPKVIQEADEDDTGTQKNFVCQLVLQYVENKYKCALDRRYKLPKMAYAYGSDQPDQVCKQRIKDRSKQPKIQEVASSSSSSSTGSRTSSKASTGAKGTKAGAKARVPVSEDKPLRWDLFLESETAEETKLTGAADLVEPLERPNDDPDEPLGLPRTMIIRAWHHPFHGSLDDNIRKIGLDASVYHVRLKLPGHRAAQVLLPYAAVPEDVEASMQPHDHVLEVRVPVDPTPYDLEADPGSRPWLLTHALDGNDEERKAQRDPDGTESEPGAAGGPRSTNGNSSSSADAEDRFHLRARKSRIDPYTGLPNRDEDPVEEDEELPEDRFHRQDALSSHYIQQREGDREEKRKKAERESQERKDTQDPDVEYIDVDDFKPGGKYGPPAFDVAARKDELAGVKYEASDDMKKAASVVADSVQGPPPTDQPSSSSKLADKLKSKVWADLLD